MIESQAIISRKSCLPAFKIGNQYDRLGTYAVFGAQPAPVWVPAGEECGDDVLQQVLHRHHRQGHRLEEAADAF